MKVRIRESYSVSLMPRCAATPMIGSVLQGGTGPDRQEGRDGQHGRDGRDGREGRKGRTEGKGAGWAAEAGRAGGARRAFIWASFSCRECCRRRRSTAARSSAGTVRLR